jgi:hypothetical protein
MRILAGIVKSLAHGRRIWHRQIMTNSKNIKADAKAERLAAALRANLRLRKAQARSIETNPENSELNHEICDETKK